VKRAFVLVLILVCWLRSDDGESQRMPAGRGKDAVGIVCAGCHGVTKIRPLRLSKERWAAKIDKMVEHGAQLTDEQLAVILDYLTNNFGVDSKLRVNSAPAVELRAILGLTANEADTIIAYRDLNGDFRDWSDLQKVAKVDWKKIEPRKDELEF
jgi:hypothetical protein